MWHPYHDDDGLAAKKSRRYWACARKNRRLSSVSRNLSIEVLLRHTDSGNDQIASVMCPLDALIKMVVQDIAERGVELKENVTLIRRFLQLAQPLRLLGWLLRDTISRNLFR